SVRGTVLSQNAAVSPLKKFCGRCRKELPADSKYLLCEDCHKRVVMSEEDREFYENSRLHY
ncbi:MAG: hypothetical protein ACREAW_01865, partial [Nitrososphaera sp.]